VGTFFHPIRFIGPSGRDLDVDALVDTGSSFSSLPGEALRDLGVRPIRKVGLTLADGQRHLQDLVEVRAELAGDEVTTLVIFGASGSPAIIGAYTLEGLALAVDPVEGSLVPMIGWRL
jgi:aspartyl protease family protein